jgi:hypothetical protein
MISNLAAQRTIYIRPTVCLPEEGKSNCFCPISKNSHTRVSRTGESPSRLTPSSAKRAVFGAVIVILILTVLEFPPPIGFETRPQSDVSIFWLVFFIVILIVEIATIPMIYRRPSIGVGLGILAAILNILQVLADQAHLENTIPRTCSA